MTVARRHRGPMQMRKELNVYIYIYIYGTITLFELALPAFISVGPCRRYDGCTLMYGFTCSSRVSSMVVPRRDTREKFCESFLRYSYSIRRYRASSNCFVTILRRVSHVVIR